MHIAADLLEAVWRLLARSHAIVVVGPELERRHRSACRVLGINVSLVHAEDVVSGELAHARSYEGELTVLTVGRLDTEKNPLLLAEILALLAADERDAGNKRGGTRDVRRWRLVVCGDGPMLPELRARLGELGLLDRVELRGYVPIDGGLLECYRHSHMFLHVSWTEGFPQVLIEAFAAGLPTVATAVGGVPAAADGAALLVAPGDAKAAADALRRLATDTELRQRLAEEALARARGCTLEVESARLAQFIASAP
jgi:glycosyltransferase involved in cell wall biosynthesis